MAHLQFQKKCFQIITDQIKGRERCFSVFMRNPTCFLSKLRDKETRRSSPRPGSKIPCVLLLKGGGENTNKT